MPNQKKITDEKAKTQFRQFSLISVVLAGVSLVVFWWLCFIAIGTSAIALNLYKHPINKADAQSRNYLVFAILGALIAFASLFLFNKSH